MEQQAKSRADHGRARPDAERISRPAAFADNRPGTVTLRTLAEAMDNSPRVVAQRKLAEALDNSPRVAAQRKLSDRMSARPAQRRAEPQGPVKPALQMKGVAINDDAGLEREADVMGARALAHSGPAPMQRQVKVLQRGQGPSVAKEVYQTWTAADAGYSYAWEGRQVNVSSENETEPVGFARYSLENIAQAVAPPAANEQYTFNAVKQRQAGTVAHLSRIENVTLTRDGPNDIYRGFATKLMEMVEAKAKSEGAWMIYLEPSKSDCRKDPNTKDKSPVDPTGFYQKLGYGYDNVATDHNNAFVDREFADLSADQRAGMKLQFNKAALGGAMQKLL